jgi:hypothetical protein
MKHPLDFGQVLPEHLRDTLVSDADRYAFFEAMTKFDASLYSAKRASEYPSIGDQLDALWKGGEAAAEMLAKVQAVKAKYPKPD